jgi:hypothetical protein
VSRARRVAFSAGVGVVAALVWLPRAGAQAGPVPVLTPGVVLNVGGCGDRVAADARRIVGIELGSLLLPPAGAAGPPAAMARLSITCEGGSAQLSAASGNGPRAVRRWMALADLPDDLAARALALAGIEMLAALSPAVRARVQARAPDPPPAIASGPPGPPGVEDGPAGRVSILGAWRTFSSAGRLTGWGGSVEVERRVRGPWGLAASVEVVAGSASSALGDARGQLGSLAACWEAAARGARWSSGVGLGARVGLAHFAGTAPPGSGVVASTVVRPWVGPALSARASLGGRSLRLAAAAEVGFAVRGARGLSGGDVLLAASGAWLAAALGVGF